MSITPFGSVLLPVGLALLFFRRKYLLWSCIALIPFFDAGVVVLSTTVIRSFHYLGLLLILSHGMDFLSRRDGPRTGFWVSGVLACVFLGAVFASVPMARLLAGKVQVLTMDTRYPDFEMTVPLAFTSQNLTQLVYPVFGVLLFLTLSRQLRTPDRLLTALKVSVFAAVAVALSGLVFQLGFCFLGEGFVRYWAACFRGSPEIDGLLGTTGAPGVHGPLPRMLSVAGEPGYTALYLLFAAGLVGGYAFGQIKTGWVRRHSPKVLLLILLGLLLSGATTALLGAGTFLGALLVVPLLGKWGRPGSPITGRERLLVVGVIVLGMVVVLSPLVAGASGEGQMASHTRKLLAQDDGGSGYVRWQTMRVGLRVFARSPLLGVGYGSHRTSALATSLLSNLGVVGTCAFLAFNAVVFSHALGVYRSSRDPALATAAFAGLLCYCTVFPVLVFAQSMVSIAFGWYWFLMAMLEATWLASQEDQADGLPACVGSGPAPQTAREARR